MTLRSILLGLAAAFVSLILLTLLVAAINRPLDALGIAVIAAIVTAVGCLTALRLRERHQA